MNRKCSWCRRDLRRLEGEESAAEAITGGICTHCDENLTAYNRRTAGDILDSMRSPVLLLDGSGKVKLGNKMALAILGKEPGEVEDRLGGEVIECVYSDFPGGCGKTEHCEACTIRNSLAETAATGRSLKNVPAYQYLKTPDGIQRKRIIISTEKKGRYVLLRIDDIDEGSWGVTNRCS
jgi:PAS domain-containing protein